MMRILLVATLVAFVTTEADAQRSRGGDPAQVWKFFAERHDKNKDGSISVDEYARGQARFASLDRNGDGMLTAADFQGGARRGGNRGNRSMNPQVVMVRIAMMADADRNRRLDRDEWKGWLKSKLREGSADAATVLGARLARTAGASLLQQLDKNSDGLLDSGELDVVFTRLDANADGRLEGTELRPGARRASQERVPQRGDLAPDFDLPYVGKSVASAKGQRAQTVSLSSFRGKRPVALIFGSYT